MKKHKTHSNPANRGATSAITVGLLAVGALTAQASSDYGPAIWRPACSGHWNTSGNGHRFLVVHDMEGYYAYEVSTSGGLRSCGTSVSVHYAINGKQDAASDYPAGEVTQFVSEAYYAWHARCWNGYSAGCEHEGFRSNPAWYTDAMYNSSSALYRHMADHYGIAKDRNHIVGHDAKSSSAWVSWANANLGINASCNTHDDPGPYWDWNRFMSLVIGGPPPPPPANNLNVYYRGSDAGLKYVYYVGGWGAPQTLDGVTAAGSSPSALYYPSTGVHNVFVRGTDGVLYYKYYSGGWSAWQYIGGSMATNSSPNAIITGDGITPNIFFRGTDGGLKYYYYAGGWSAQQSIAGTALAANSSPMAMIVGGITEVFYRGTDGTLKYVYYSGGWSAVQTVAGTAIAPNTSPAPIMVGGIAEVYYQATDGTLRYVYYSGGWIAVQISGTAMAADSSPSPVMTSSGIINVHYRGTDGALKYVYYSSGWGPQVNVGGAIAAGSSPSAIVGSGGILNVYYRGTDNALHYFYYSGGWSGVQTLTATGAMTESPFPIKY
jgi:hypothetical protein